MLLLSSDGVAIICVLKDEEVLCGKKCGWFADAEGDAVYKRERRWVPEKGKSPLLRSKAQGTRSRVNSVSRYSAIAFL